MDKKLNVVIALLVLIAALMVVDMFSSRLNGQSSSAARLQDDPTGSAGGISGGR